MSCRWGTSLNVVTSVVQLDSVIPLDEEELGRKIQAALRRLQVVGGVLVTIALLLQLVWIVPMASLLPELAAANTPYRAGGALGN